MQAPAVVYWLLPVAFLLHDAEELATMPVWIASHRADLESLFGRVGAAGFVGALPSTYGRPAVAIGFVLAAFVAVTAMAARREGSRAWRLLYAGLLGGFFLHAFTHIGQSLLFGTYTPGVVTAVLVVIPASLLIYRRLLAAGVLTVREAAAAAAAAFVLFVPAVLLALAAAAWLARA